MRIYKVKKDYDVSRAATTAPKLAPKASEDGRYSLLSKSVKERKEDILEKKTQGGRNPGVQKAVQKVKSRVADTPGEAREADIWTPEFWSELIDIVQNVELNYSQKVLTQKGGKWKVVAEKLLTHSDLVRDLETQFGSELSNYLTPDRLSRCFTDVSSDTKRRSKSLRFGSGVDEGVVKKFKQYRNSKKRREKRLRDNEEGTLQDVKSGRPRTHEVKSRRPGQFPRRGKRTTRLVESEVSNKEDLLGNNLESCERAHDVTNETPGIEVSYSDPDPTDCSYIPDPEAIDSDFFSIFGAMGIEVNDRLMGISKKKFCEALEQEFGDAYERFKSLLESESSRSRADTRIRRACLDWQNSITTQVKSATEKLAGEVILELKNLEYYCL